MIDQRIRREQWTMAQLELFEHPQWFARVERAFSLRGYLLVSALMLIARAIEVGD